MTQPNLPAAWNETEQLDGLDIIDKTKLVGVPFRITGFYFYTNDSGVKYVVIDAENTDGSTFTFNDSSSGIRQQIVTYLAAKGDDSAVSSGEYVDASIVVPRGVRISEFETTDERGKPKMARTCYLTTSGKRAGANEKKAQAPTKRTAAK